MMFRMEALDYTFIPLESECPNQNVSKNGTLMRTNFRCYWYHCTQNSLCERIVMCFIPIISRNLLSRILSIDFVNMSA